MCLYRPKLMAICRPLIEKKYSTKYTIFAFDAPFNRNISVVKGRKYIGEAHLIEKLNVVEKKRYKIIQHINEQDNQYKFYSESVNATPFCLNTATLDCQ